MVPHLSLLARLRLFAEYVFGRRYAAVVSLLDRALTVFLVTFAAKAVAGGLFSVGHVADLSIWQTAAYAGAAAVLSLLKSSVLIKLTGDPALLSLTSATLRARRDAGRRVAHAVPLRAVRRPQPGTPRPRHAIHEEPAR